MYAVSTFRAGLHVHHLGCCAAFPIPAVFPYLSTSAWLPALSSHSAWVCVKVYFCLPGHSPAAALHLKEIRFCFVNFKWTKQEGELCWSVCASLNAVSWLQADSQVVYFVLQTFWEMPEIHSNPGLYTNSFRTAPEAIWLSVFTCRETGRNYCRRGNTRERMCNSMSSPVIFPANPMCTHLCPSSRD